MTRQRITAVIAVAALAALMSGNPAGAAPRAHVATTCKSPHYPGVGYFTSLTVSGTTCTTGKDVAVAYYHCRLAHGGVKGRCPGGVLGFKCTEVRNSIPTEIDARVTCTKGHEKVVHTYQQDTEG